MKDKHQRKSFFRPSFSIKNFLLTSINIQKGKEDLAMNQRQTEKQGRHVWHGVSSLNRMGRDVSKEAHPSYTGRGDLPGRQKSKWKRQWTEKASYVTNAGKPLSGSQAYHKDSSGFYSVCKGQI